MPTMPLSLVGGSRKYDEDFDMAIYERLRSHSASQYGHRSNKRSTSVLAIHLLLCRGGKDTRVIGKMH